MPIFRANPQPSGMLILVVAAHGISAGRGAYRDAIVRGLMIMLARSLAIAALFLAVVPELTRAAENESVKTGETATTVKNDARGAATENPDLAKSIGAKSTGAESTGAESSRTESRRAAPRSTRILYITAKDCEQCAAELARLRKPGGEFEAMQSQGWKIGEGPENHLQIVDREAVPDLVLQLRVRE